MWNVIAKTSLSIRFPIKLNTKCLVILCTSTFNTLASTGFCKTCRDPLVWESSMICRILPTVHPKLGKYYDPNFIQLSLICIALLSVDMATLQLYTNPDVNLDP